MGSVASKSGRRLSVACIGMAEDGEDLSTLDEMVDEATSYGAIASFSKPSLDADSLSNIITNLASSLTASKTEMTNMETGAPKKVRMDIIRERIDASDDKSITSDWKCYTRTSSNVVNRIWSWSTELNDFAQVIDNRCGECWRRTSHYRCEYCDAFLLCKKCANSSNIRLHKTSKDCSRNIAKVRSGRLVKESLLLSFSIAMKEQIFGEGAERVVRKCRFLDKYNDFIGPVMVAKESRFVDDSSSDYNKTSYEKRMEYHKECMRTQSMAEEMAKHFNDALESAAQHFKPKSRKMVEKQIRLIPKMKFLKPFVVETLSDEVEWNFLVESILQGVYKKCNDNMGMVRGQSKAVSAENLSSAMDNLRIGNELHGFGGLGLGFITEEDSEEEDSDNELIEEQNSTPEYGSYPLGKIKDALVPQAFSHFSYEKSKKYFMVVDCQGVLNRNKDGTKC